MKPVFLFTGNKRTSFLEVKVKENMFYPTSGSMNDMMTEAFRKQVEHDWSEWEKSGWKGRLYHVSSEYFGFTLCGVEGKRNCATHL